MAFFSFTVILRHSQGSDVLIYFLRRGLFERRNSFPIAHASSAVQKIYQYVRPDKTQPRAFKEHEVVWKRSVTRTVKLLLSRAAVRMNAWFGLSQVANRRGSHGGSAHGTNGRDPITDLYIG